MLVIVDADALIALSVPSDGNHFNAAFIIRNCQEQKVHYIIPATAICEAVTVLHRKKANAEDILQKLADKVPRTEMERQELLSKRAAAQESQTVNSSGLDFLLQFVKTSRVRCQSIDKEIVLEAIAKFNVNGRAADTLYDAIIATLAIRYDADAVFSFDHVYPTMGLRLARDLFP